MTEVHNPEKFRLSHEMVMRLDKDQPNEYRTDRSLPVDNLLNFNILDHLQRTASRNSGRRIDVLDGGCGKGVALEQLKRGLRVSADDYREGLGNRVRTVGVTLSESHAEYIRKRDSEYRVDEVLVGPIGGQDFGRQFDFILDSRGAAWYFPEEAISKYGEVLKPGGVALVSLLSGAMPEGQHIALFRSTGLRIENLAGNPKAKVDVLASKATL